MIRKKASNAFEKIILDNILRCGWHSNSVGADSHSAWFAYTVGFFDSYGHPELIVFGRSPRDSHRIFIAAAKSITRQRPLNPSVPTDRLLRGRSCVLVKVPKRLYADFVISACWYYDGTRFPLYQVVWPSEEGHFPWHPDATNAMREVQPVLGQYSMTV